MTDIGGFAEGRVVRQSQPVDFPTCTGYFETPLNVQVIEIRIYIVDGFGELLDPLG